MCRRSSFGGMSILKIYNKRGHGRREIILDIETTGLFTKDGNRILEVAAIEVRGHKLTGREFHAVINPERDIPAEVTKIHGITNEKVKGKPVFADIAKQLREFIGDDPVVITCRTKDEYTLDIAFMNMELARAGFGEIPQEQWVNVRRWSELMFGDKAATLDKVLDKYDVSRKERDENGHSAILDARLLAEVYPRLQRDYTSFKQGKAPAASKTNKPNTP